MRRYGFWLSGREKGFREMEPNERFLLNGSDFRETHTNNNLFQGSEAYNDMAVA